MNKRHIVITLATGAALSLGACGGSASPPEITHNPPPPPVQDPPRNPPSPKPPTQPVALPTWDQVPSGHPEGATNPPSPKLIVTPDGDCYKFWQPAMDSQMVVPVRACDDDCGTPIQCPPQAAKLLEDYKAKHK